jgi:2'-5' RNA ligase
MSGRSAPFPATPPASLADTDVIHEHDWASFQQVETMVEHWNRPGWWPGRASYHWMVLTRPNSAVLDLVRQVQSGLAEHSGLDLVASDALHLTVSRVGWESDVPLGQLPRLAAAARARCADLKSLELEVGPLAGSRGAIRLSVAPWDDLLRLHDRLRAATIDVLGETATPPPRSAFRPHLGVAYSRRVQPAGPLVQAVEALRPLPRALQVVSAAELVRLERADRGYLVQPVHTVQLSG